MLSRRFTKRIIFFAIFVIVILLFSGIFWLLTRPEESQTPVEKEGNEYESVTVEEVSVVNHGNSVDLVARLRNPNVRAGVPEYPVTFTIFTASDQKITTHTEDAYILPGAVQYVAALNIRTGGNHVSRVQVDTPTDPEFSEIPKTVSLPSFSSFLQNRRTRMIGDQEIEEQTGIVKNTSTFDWQRVEVVGVALDRNEDVVGVGKTFLGKLKVDEQREFNLQWPAPSTPTDRVIVVPSTNVYEEDNVIDVIGDPGSLR